MESSDLATNQTLRVEYLLGSRQPLIHHPLQVLSDPAAPPVKGWLGATTIIPICHVIPGRRQDIGRALTVDAWKAWHCPGHRGRITEPARRGRLHPLAQQLDGRSE